METGSSSAILFVLGILAVPILLILIGYGLVVFWRKKTQDAIRQVGGQIEGYDRQLNEMHAFLEKFARINKEPYATHLNALRGVVNELQTQLELFLESSREFEAQVQNARTRRLHDIINAPLNGLRDWRRSKELRQESSAISERLSAADERIQRIHALPWELAQQCRQAEKDLEEVDRSAQDLQSKGARGAGLQMILRQAPLLRQDLDKVPAVFFEADQAGLLSAADYEATIHVFDVLTRIQPAISRYLPLVREWGSHHQRAAAEFDELKLAGANLRQSMANPPEGLVVTALQSRLDQIAQLAADISQRLSQPEAEGLKGLSREISQLRKVIQDTEQQLGRARQQMGSLSQALAELKAGMEKLSAQYDAQEHSEPFPLAWDESCPLLSELRNRLQALGPEQQPRTPEQVAAHLKEVEVLRADFKALSELYPRVTGQHRALLALLESPELKDGAAWLRKSQDMLAQVNIYDPRNWSKQDALQALPEELSGLRQAHEQLVPADRSASVKESTLDQRLKDTQKLAAQHKALRPRVESVWSRLEKVKSMETEGKDRLNSCYAALEPVLILTDSNDLLYEIAGAELDRLNEEIRQLVNELNAQSQGEMEKKLQKINALGDKVNRALNGWLAQLNAAIAEQGKAMNDQLIQLDTIGTLDEQPVIDAHNLLSREEYLSALHGPAAASASPAGRLRDAVRQRQPQRSDLDATAEIKRKNDLWQTMLTTRRAMEEKTGALLSAYQEAVRARNEAREKASEVVKRTPNKRGWPPNNQTPLDEAQLLGPVDSRWESMKGMPRRIDTAILEIGRLTQQYRLAIERADQALNRVEQDEERVRELEEEIGELKQRWQAQAQADAGNAVVREGVQTLMSQADSRMSYIRQQYIRGAITYEETIHNLRLLNDELFAARVPVDEKNDIGLNEKPGRIHAS